MFWSERTQYEVMGQVRQVRGFEEGPSTSISVVFSSVDSHGSSIYHLLYVYFLHGVHSGRGLVPISGRPFKILMHGRGYYFGDDLGGITG